PLPGKHPCTRKRWTRRPKTRKKRAQKTNWTCSWQNVAPLIGSPQIASKGNKVSKDNRASRDNRVAASKVIIGIHKVDFREGSKGNKVSKGDKGHKAARWKLIGAGTKAS